MVPWLSERKSTVCANEIMFIALGVEPGLNRGNISMEFGGYVVVIFRPIVDLRPVGAPILAFPCIHSTKKDEVGIGFGSIKTVSAEIVDAHVAGLRPGGSAVS